MAYLFVCILYEHECGPVFNYKGYYIYTENMQAKEDSLDIGKPSSLICS